MSVEEAAARREAARREGRVVVFTNGCFDVLHAGHVDYLEAARSLGDLLAVGLNGDSSMRRIKGPERPLNPESDRAAVLAGLAAVDMVVVFDEDDPLALIVALGPDVLVKGADWAEEDIIGGPEVKARGGRIERISMTEGRSTTGLIETVLERYGK